MSYQDDKWAEFYDELHQWLNPTDCVNFIRKRCTTGPVGEFAVGTGRVAVPIGNSGIRVFGSDVSHAMINQLNSKQCPNVTGIIGDACRTPFPEKVELAYIVFNSLYTFLSFERQQAFFTNAYQQLTGNGLLIVEGFLPDHSQFHEDKSCRIFELSGTRRTVVNSRHKIADQLIDTKIDYIRDGITHQLTTSTRYIQLDELDLMAQAAGFSLIERYGDWNEKPFSENDKNAISVYQAS